jgi:thiamine-monophosphate kinase
MSELQLIAALKQQLLAHPEVSIGIGDDAALWHPKQNNVLVTTDMLLDHKHFVLGKDPARLIGHKSLAVNLSDIAAMGGEASVATVSLALPRQGLPENFLGEFYLGMSELAKRFNVGIIGGDTNSWDGPFAVSITVLGVAHPQGVVQRGGARPGDIVCVTGPLGGSLSGKHLTFEPKLREAKAMLDRFMPHAMLDISDGLATDLRHICAASHCGAVLFQRAIPITDAGQRQRDPLRAALCDGEDFELCVVIAESDWKEWQYEPELGPLVQIGMITSKEGLFIEATNGQREELNWRGFEHDFATDKT